MKLDICLFALFAAAIGIAAAFRPSAWIVAEGFCGLLCRNGKSLHRLSPGRHRFWRRGYTVTFVDLRPKKLAIAAVNCVSADEVTLNVTAVLNCQVIQAETVTYEVSNHVTRLETVAQAAVRSVVSLRTLNELNTQPWEIRRQLLAHVELDADRMGVVVRSLEIKQLEVVEAGRHEATLV